MNTLEVKIKNKIKSWDDFYKYAKKQFINYEKLEGIDNWDKYDFSIDCSEDQMKFKDMIQIRFIEELTEASKAINEPDHFWEEITDSLNFFISSYIMIGVDFNELINPDLYLLDNNVLTIPDYNRIKICFYDLIEKVGYLCNLLKNRPWAQSNYLVSMVDFNERLKDLWDYYWYVLGIIFGINKKYLFELFERKLTVNEWRIKTGY